MNIHKMGDVGYDDMITMDHLTDELLLANLQKRFKQDVIYVCYFFLITITFQYTFYCLSNKLRFLILIEYVDYFTTILWVSTNLYT